MVFGPWERVYGGYRMQKLGSWERVIRCVINMLYVDLGLIPLS